VIHTASDRTGGDVYSATFNCAIHPDADVDYCSVELVTNGRPTRQSKA